LGLLLALALPGAARAASVSATGVISGSALTIATSSAPAFTASLDAGDATPSYALALSTQDTRGTGAGWNETVTSTQFTTGAPGNFTLPATASTVTGVSTAGGTGANTAPADGISYPIGVPSAPSAPTPVKFFDSTTNSGMGRFTISPTVAVFVPQDSYAGTYTSTLTLGIASGP
jgi:hypothetical protein